MRTVLEPPLKVDVSYLIKKTELQKMHYEIERLRKETEALKAQLEKQAEQRERKKPRLDKVIK